MQQEWFDNPQWWFASDDEIDHIVCDKFGSLLNCDQGNDNDIGNAIDLIDQILKYDQLPRHLFRHQPANHVITYFLQKALQCADELTIHRHNLLSPEQVCFALMPYRHTDNYDIITQKVLPVAWQALEFNPDNAVLKRFIKATYNRMPLVPCSRVDDTVKVSVDKSILAFTPGRDVQRQGHRKGRQ